MAIHYTEEQRKKISAEAKGKTVESLEYSEGDPNDPNDKVGGYWVMTFTDESEMSFRFMAEIWEGTDLEVKVRSKA